MADAKRVVLIKPGDVLLIGNVRSATAEDLEHALDGLQRLGLSPVLLFTDDIQIDALTSEQLADLAGR